MKQMFITRKLSAFLMAFLLLVSLFPVAAVPVSAEAGIITVGEDAAASAQDILNGLDMLETPQADLDATITRGDFAKLLADMMRYNGFATPATGYRDVLEQTKNSKEISFAIEQGYMAGDKGLFRPFDPITYAEAVKALVEMTGNNIQKRITTDSAYMMKASGLGITKAIDSKDGNAFLSAGAAYKLAVNTLSVNSLKMAAIEGGYVSEVDNGNFLEVMHGVKRVSGILTKTRNAGIYTAGGTGLKAIEIDQIRFAAKEDWTKYLGYQVYAYVDYSGENAEVLHMVPANENEVLLLKAEDIISVNNAKTELVYNITDDEDEDEEMTLSNTTTVIWNGSFGGTLVNYTANQIALRSEAGAPKAGYVSVIDSDGDNVCDVLNIMSYEMYFTAYADKSKEWLIDKNRSGDAKVIKVGDYNENRQTLMYANGTEAGFDVMDKDLVIHIAESYDHKNIVAIIGETEVEVTISEIRDNGGVTEYRAGDTWYVGNDYFDLYYKTGAAQMYVGWHGYLKLDLDGRITVAEPDSASHTGYLIAISQPQGLETKRQAKMFSNFETAMDAYEIQIFDFADKVQVDPGVGSYTTVKAEDLRNLAVFKNGAAFRDQLVRFTVNKEKKISGIQTANTSKTWGYTDFQSGESDSQEWFSDHSDFALCYDAEKDGATLTADNTLKFNMPSPSYSTGLIFANLVGLDAESVPLWVIPADLNDDKGYACATYEDYTMDAAPNVKVYDLKQAGEASAIVWRQQSSGGRAPKFETYRRVFVTDIKKVADEDGAITTEIRGYRNTRYSSEKMGMITLRAVDNTLFDDILVGDLFGYDVDSNGNVTAVQMIFSYKNRYEVTNTVGLETDYSYGTSGGEKYVRREPAVAGSQASWTGYSSPYFGKVLYNNTVSVTLTFDDPRNSTDYFGSSHQTFAKMNWFQWIVFDTKTEETKLETSPAIYSILDVGDPADANDVFIAAAQLYGVSMGIVYVK